MRDKIRALYYPDFWVPAATLKKAILIFDEIHFMDRPSFMFGGGRDGSVGMVGAASPIRPYEQSFSDNGVPLYVQLAPGGPAPDELLEKVEADLSDLNFMTRFQEGLRTSQHFRDLPGAQRELKLRPPRENWGVPLRTSTPPGDLQGGGAATLAPPGGTGVDYNTATEEKEMIKNIFRCSTAVLVFGALLAAMLSAQEPVAPAAQTPPESNVRRAIPWKQFDYTCEGGAKLTVYLRGDMAKIRFQD